MLPLLVLFGQLAFQDGSISPLGPRSPLASPGIDSTSVLQPTDAGYAAAQGFGQFLSYPSGAMPASDAPLD